MKSRTKVSADHASSGQVQVFSALTQMRYKPVSQHGTQALLKNRQKLGKKNQEYVNLYDPFTMTLEPMPQKQSEPTRRLKFLASLSPEHFIIGNENQIDMVGFGMISHGYVDTEYHWSLSLKGPIESICVDSKKSMFLILSGSTIYFYQYNLKSREPPTVKNQIPVKEGVRFVRFLKDILLGIFYSTNYEIYNIQNLNSIKKKSQKNYNVGKEKKLLTIPNSIDYIINLFFEEPKQKKQSFILWCLQINFQSQIKTKQPYRVYDIMNYAKQKLSVQNYSKDIIFLGIGHQIMAMKNGYLIDTVNLKVSSESQILKYLHPNTILHINKKNVEVHHFYINVNVKPEKIVLHTTDSIELKKVPQKANYMSVLRTFKDNFAIFFEDSIKKRHQTRGEITYYFQISQNTTIKEKMDMLFDSIQQNLNNPEFIDQKYDIAMKMGISQKEVYLQIWSRSMKSTIEDYQYLLATKDYKIIKAEIQKKLKKQSMVLRQLIRIEESCHEINRELVNSTTCTQQQIKDFVSSHFLLKKLKVFKQIAALDRWSVMQQSDQDENSNLKQLKIDVHKYFYYRNADIKAFLVDLIYDMLFNLKNNAKVIRLVMKNFKFLYRLIYKQILADIITTAKQNLIDLLNELPQLLPFSHQDLNSDQVKEGLYGGIWGPVDHQQWEKQLYPTKIQTLYNRDTLKDFLKSIWFKRYYLTSHGLTTLNAKQIEQINDFNNSDRLFYFFISHLYAHFKTNKSQYFQIIHFLEQKYELYPSHLKGKAPLYENLYIYYFNEEHNSNKLNFAQFLQWDDQLLFKYFFDHQKVKKNCLLKQIKPIYEQSDSDGDHLFNIGLFSYFFSDISEVSDLKFILNRINNEKAEFHKKNKGIYDVLIRSVQFKIKLGTGKDVPLDEVMIYIQNIQLDENDQILDELFIMDHIKLETQLFQQMKINMSIKEIMEQYETVFDKIIDHKIEKHHIKNIQTYENFKEQSTNILRELIRIKKSIYDEQDSRYIILGYLCTVLQQEQFIEMTGRFLEEQEVHQLFQLDKTTIQNLILYMYKWSFTISSKYTQNKNYLRKLFDLLPADNEVRLYLETNLEIGLLLSSEEEPLEYPLCKTSNYPNIKVIRETFKYNNSQFLLSLDLNRLNDLLKILERLVFGEEKAAPQPLTLHKLYQILIVQLLNKQNFKEVIAFIKKILDIESPIKDIGILYVALYILKTAKEFNQESRKCIYRLLALYFYKPLELLEILEFSIKTELTGLEQSNYLKQIIEKQATKSNFNPENPIMNSQFTSFYKDPNSHMIIEAYRQFLKSKNSQFQNLSQYDIIFTFLCQSPYLLLKFLHILKGELYYKNVFLFLMMTLSRPIFNRNKAYEAMKRIFSALAICSKEMKSADEFVLSFSSKSLNDEYQLPKFIKVTEYEQKVNKISKIFQKQIFKLNKSKIKEAVTEKNLLMLKKAMSNPNQVLQDQFEAADEDNIDFSEEITKKQRKKRQKIEFNSFLEKQIYFYRSIDLVDFLANKESGKIQKQVSLNLIRKQSAPLLLKALKSNKDTNYLSTKKHAIQHLYSHKKITGSEIHEEEQTMRQDEEFLDSFLPKHEQSSRSKSKVTLAAIRNSGSIRKSRSKQMSSPTDKKQEKPYKILDLVDHQIIQQNQNSPPELATISNLKINHHNIQKLSYLREELIKSYNQSKIPKFDISPLEKEIDIIGQNTVKSSELNYSITFLENFFKYLYDESSNNLSINLKLMEEISRRHPQINVNIFFLQAYQRTFQTNQKLGLDMNIKSFLPLSGIYIKSKDIFDLYVEIQPLVKTQINDESVFKLSKLIALGFRKSIVEQEILCSYLHILMQNYLIATYTDIPQVTQKIRNIMQKLQVQVLIDKIEGLLNSLHQCERKAILFDMCMEWLKNRGYGTVAKQIRSKVK